MGMPTVQGDIYHNHSVLHPNGSLMFNCSEQRYQWYLRKGLAKVVSDDPPVIQLTFTPKGPGPQHPFYTSYKKNCCVVCGSEEKLTKHHIVPVCFRRHLPDRLKKFSSHDVLPLCKKCHQTYETIANRKKDDIAEAFGINRHNPKQVVYLGNVEAFKFANALAKHGDTIPAERKEYMLKVIREEFPNIDPTPEKLKELGSLRRNRRIMDGEDYYKRCTKSPLGEAVMAKIDDVDAFMREWRQHFVDTMQPQFLPTGWEVNYNFPNLRVTFWQQAWAFLSSFFRRTNETLA